MGHTRAVRSCNRRCSGNDVLCLLQRVEHAIEARDRRMTNHPYRRQDCRRESITIRWLHRVKERELL